MSSVLFANIPTFWVKKDSAIKTWIKSGSKKYWLKIFLTQTNFGSEKCWVQNSFGSKHFLVGKDSVPKEILVKKILGPIKFCSKTICSKKLCLKKYVQKKICSKTFRVQKDFGSRKIAGPKIFFSETKKILVRLGV